MSRRKHNSKKSIKKSRKAFKPQLYRFTSQLYHFMRDNPYNIILKKLSRNVYGWYVEYDESEGPVDEIYIDYRRNVISILVHEFTHRIKKSWSETKVLREESRIMNALSYNQVRHILKTLASIL